MSEGISDDGPTDADFQNWNEHNDHADGERPDQDPAELEPDPEPPAAVSVFPIGHAHAYVGLTPELATLIKLAAAVCGEVAEHGVQGAAERALAQFADPDHVEALGVGLEKALRGDPVIGDAVAAMRWPDRRLPAGEEPPPDVERVVVEVSWEQPLTRFYNATVTIGLLAREMGKTPQEVWQIARAGDLGDHVVALKDLFDKTEMGLGDEYTEEVGDRAITDYVSPQYNLGVVC